MFNKDLEEPKNKQTKRNNAKTEMKNTLEGITSRITEAEGQISDLEDRMVEVTAAEQTKDKKNEKKWRQPFNGSHRAGTPGVSPLPHVPPLVQV